MGLNAHARMKEAGMLVKKTDVLRLPLSEMVVVTKGPTAHPRAGYPLDVALKEHIKKHGVPTHERRFKVQEDGDRVIVIDGARRYKAATVAEKELRAEGKRVWPLEKPYDNDDDPGHLYIECEVVSVKPLDIILERLAANVSRGLPDTVDVLAASVAQIVAFKYQQAVPDDDLASHVASAVALGVDVVTTSGAATGQAPTIEKIQRIRAALGDHALAIASGITPENVAPFVPFTDAFLVATGIETKFGVLDSARVRALADVIHETPKVGAP